jgi:hypothetical protein
MGIYSVRMSSGYMCLCILCHAHVIVEVQIRTMECEGYNGLNKPILVHNAANMNYFTRIIYEPLPKCNLTNADHSNFSS